jgi:hypothetical protein
MDLLECHGMWGGRAQAMLNPFYTKGAPLGNSLLVGGGGTSVLETRIKLLARKYL